MAEEKTPAGQHEGVPSDGGIASIKSVKWDDTRMATFFANVVNVLSTREEFSLLFGTNQTWNIAENGELVVQLTNRIVLTPHAAKRLYLLLHNRLQDFETRFSSIEI